MVTVVVVGVAVRRFVKVQCLRLVCGAGCCLCVQFVVCWGEGGGGVDWLKSWMKLNMDGRRVYASMCVCCGCAQEVSGINMCTYNCL